jgi:hypothetical protein
MSALRPSADRYWSRSVPRRPIRSSRCVRGPGHQPPIHRKAIRRRDPANRQPQSTARHSSGGITTTKFDHRNEAEERSRLPRSAMYPCPLSTLTISKSPSLRIVRESSSSRSCADRSKPVASPHLQQPTWLPSHPHARQPRQASAGLSLTPYLQSAALSMRDRRSQSRQTPPTLDPPVRAPAASDAAAFLQHPQGRPSRGTSNRR